jgi:hypothetical protein
MEIAGPNNPTTVINDSTVGTLDWNNPENAKVSDDAHASKTLQLNDITHYLLAKKFNFGIPPGAEINGIKVDIERHGQSQWSIRDYSIKIVKNGTPQGTDKAVTTAWWPTSDTYRSYGGESDLWGLTWTPDDINANGFGVAISAKCFVSGNAPRVDHIRITIYYTPVEQRPSKGNGYHDPGTAENDNSVGTVAWSDVDNCKKSDDSHASVTLGASVISNYLKATNFGFQLPDDAIVKGIKVQIEKKASAADKIKDYSVKLVKGGIIQGDDKKSSDFWKAYDGYTAYGGITTLWGLSWTPADINASDFGVVIAAINENTGDIAASIDHICLSVYYGFSTPPISEAFQKLMEQPGSEKVYLVEMQPAVEMKNWLHFDDGIYYQPWIEKHINVIPKIVKVEENGVELTEESSFANMQDNPGSWYLEGDIESYWDDGDTEWDGGETLWDMWPELYIHTSDNGDADDKAIMVYVKLRFASQPMIFDNNFYFPRVQKGGVPALGMESSDIFAFETSVGGGSIKLLNGDQFFDKIYRDYIWRSKEVKILVGGRDLLYTEFRAQFVGKIQSSSFSDNEVEFALRDVRVDLHKKLPLNKYYTADYPNMDPDAEGSSIPLIWGDLHNVPATLIDSTVQKGKYKVADHANKEGDALYAIDAVYNNGNQIDAGHLTLDLANGEFTILSSYSGNPGTITCDVKGRKDDDEGSITGYADSMIKKASDIIRDICVNLLGIEKLDEDDFAEARIDAPQELAIYLGDEEYSNKVIEKICQSVMGHFVIAANGYVHFSIWTEEVLDDVVELKEEDILSFKESCEIEEIFWKFVIMYDQDPSSSDFKAVQAKDDTVEYKYKRSIPKEVETYLKLQTDAEELAADMLAECNSERGKYEVETKLKAIELKVGDKVKISRSRAPASEGKFVGKVFRVLGISKDISNMRTRLILMED